MDNNINSLGNNWQIPKVDSVSDHERDDNQNSKNQRGSDNQEDEVSKKIMDLIQEGSIKITAAILAQSFEENNISFSWEDINRVAETICNKKLLKISKEILLKDILKKS